MSSHKNPTPNNSSISFYKFYGLVDVKKEIIQNANKFIFIAYILKFSSFFDR